MYLEEEMERVKQKLAKAERLLNKEEE